MNSDIKENVLVLKDENGLEKKYEILATVSSKENDKDYLIFTDNSLDEDGNTITYANIYDKTGKDKKLYPLESEEEIAFIEKLLVNLENKINSGE